MRKEGDGRGRDRNMSIWKRRRGQRWKEKRKAKEGTHSKKLECSEYGTPNAIVSGVESR